LGRAVLSYFIDATRIAKEEAKSKGLARRMKTQTTPSLHMPNETEILDICRDGEDQIHEFKAAGTDVQKLTKEIAAFANTKLGGLILYGVENDGTITGTDKRRQELDQPLQNSVRNSILPSLVIDIAEKDVLGHKIYPNPHSCLEQKGCLSVRRKSTHKTRYECFCRKTRAIPKAPQRNPDSLTVLAHSPKFGHFEKSEATKLI